MAALGLVVLCGCSTVKFYSQALGGQAEILRKARPAAVVLKDPKTKPLLKEKLTTVADILDYAEKEMHLPARSQYDRYTDLGRRYVVWVVFASPEFSVEAKRWWYPLVGRLSYRGFFTEEAAKAEADKLRAEGLDVHTGGVEAYSTLGFLRDPLLNTFMGRKDADLAELIFHELTHQRLYLSGDTDFNEAFATSVGREGARRWLRARGRLKDLAQYEKEMRIEQEFIAIALRTRSELKTLYAQEPKPADDVMRTEKSALMALLRQRADAMDRRHGGSLKLERWFTKPVNNARLNTVSTYYTLLPGFDALLRQHGGDLDAFYGTVEGMKNLSKKERRERLEAAAAAASAQR